MKYLLFTALVFLWACSKPAAEPAPPAASAPPQSQTVTVEKGIRDQVGIEVETVQVGKSGSPVLATGQLQINEDTTWHVGALTEGKIVSVPAKVGDQVREGQILAALHSHDIHDARASYRQTQAELQRQKTLADQALSVRDRTRRLYELRAASKEQLDAAETQYRSALISVTSAQAEAEKAEFHLTEYLEVPVQAPAHTTSDSDTIAIKSPANGTVMARQASIGTVVTAGDPVFTVSNLSSLWFIGAVNEVDLSSIRKGQKVSIKVRAYPDRAFAGTVLQAGERMDPQTRTLQVRVLVPNQQGLLKPDMFASGEFAAAGGRTGIWVPETALQEMDGKQVVFVQQKDGSFKARPVETRPASDAGVEILAGLEPGTPIAIKGAFLLKARATQTSSGAQ